MLPKVQPFELFCKHFLVIKITPQASRRINSLKIKDNTEFSVKQNHAWNHNEKPGARGGVSYFISIKNFHKPLPLQPTFLTDSQGFCWGFFPPLWPWNYLRSFMAMSISQGMLCHTLGEGGGQQEEP